jgi:hypothetical protein
MRVRGIALKIWLSVGVFAVGACISLGVSQVEAVFSEARLRTTSEALFPAAQRGQQADTAFERMAKGFQDAVVLEEATALDQAEKDGEAAAADLKAAAGLAGLAAERATALDALAASVSGFAHDAKAGYGPMLKAGGNLTAEMGQTSRKLADQTAGLKKAVGAMREQLAADLRGELTQAVDGSARQRWVSLLV